MFDRGHTHIASAFSVREVRVLKFIMQVTGTYNQQFRRPFQASLQADVQSQLQRVVSQYKRITAPVLAGVAESFLAPQAKVEGPADIPNGWTMPRLRFLLMVEFVRHDNTKLIEIITGYSEHNDVSYGGNIDPNMRFVINNITKSAIIQYSVAVPGSHQSQVVNAPGVVTTSHVFANHSYQHIQCPTSTLLRPEDVLGEIENVPLRGGFDGGNYQDANGLLTSEATLSARRNASSPQYMAKFIDAYRMSTAGNQLTTSNDEIMSDVKAIVRTEDSMADDFLSLLRSRMQASITPNFFTLGVLEQIDPNVRHVMKLVEVSPQMLGSLHQAGLTANWDSAYIETQFATQLAQSLPGYLFDSLLFRFDFVATNHNTGGEITVIPGNAAPMLEGFDLVQAMEKLRFRLETELFRALSHNSQLAFMVDVRCDLLGETWMMIKINSDPECHYVVPSFGDALISPVITGNRGVLQSMADNFSLLLNAVGGDTSQAPVNLTVPSDFI